MPVPSFSPQTTQRLHHAEQACRCRGARLTDLRRDVLGLVLESAKPVGAYDLLDRFREHHKGAAPPTVYRALEFLMEHGFVHKLEGMSAYVACVNAIDRAAAGRAADPHLHAAQFLICGDCGRATELEDKAIHTALAHAATNLGFVAKSATVEVQGICTDCRTDSRLAGAGN